ncbi:autotransporter domain-containing protein [Yersinia thracica]|uniref:autotransporter domain-containing protein n=1 Tax=Yersinia thracica TaxID=2890319 RepID=UPI0011A72402|nr:autotransporter serine protease [Yersinia thracica]
MKTKSRLVLGTSLGCLFFPAAVLAAGSPFPESGRPGVPDSWLTPEFNCQWGLGAINAHHAYARGYNGQGVNMGVLDGKLFPHPEFAGKLAIISDYLPYNFDKDENSEAITFGSHGAHVAGIAAASRDGAGMHGVAFGATLATGSVPRTDSQLEYMTQSNVRVINNSWGDYPPIETDAEGNDVSLPNGTYKYQQVTPASQLDKLAPLKARIDAFSRAPIPRVIANDNLDIAGYAGMLRAARHGKLIVFAAGNSNNYNVPMRDESIPYFFPEVVSHYLMVTNLTPDDELAVSSTSCGHTASYCVSAPGTDIYSAVGHFASRTGDHITEAALNQGELSVAPGYANMTGTSMAAPLVTGAAAVLMQRFPYMTTEQISTVLKTTATDLGAPGIDARFGWGKINLKDAIDGPRMLIAPADIPAELYVPGSYTQTQFVATIPGAGALLDPGTPLERRCTGPECAWDIWRNDIAGHGGLTKEGAGTLVLRGHNTYHGPTQVNQGTLMVNGSLTSDVSVQDGGVLGGNGSIGSLVAQAGGAVAPGNGIGTLTVANDVTFDADSGYAVEVTTEGRSDRIQSAGKARLKGGEVAVTLESRGNLLSPKEVRSLLGQRYSILTAAQGIEGQFTAVQPNSLFLGTGLSYRPQQVELTVVRNATPFAVVAATTNERAVAVAAERLPVGHPVYESVLMSDSATQARQAFRQLSGQVHADVLAAQINDSHALRETLNGRLRQSEGLAGTSGIRADEHGAWATLLGGWGQATGDTNATGYQTSTSGVMLGADRRVGGHLRLGVATGYTRTTLQGGYGASATRKNVPLALYGSVAWGDLALRAGAANTWHRIDTRRNIAYGSQSDRVEAGYTAQTQQLFAEAGYRLDMPLGVSLEPFAGLAYVRTANGGFAEKGGGAALQGNRQHQDAMFSTAGLRAEKRWQAGGAVDMGVYGELGWQHQLGKTARDADLKFNNTAAFTVGSVPADRDSALVRAGVEAKLYDNATLSLGYGGQLSSRQQDNSVNAGFSWRF